MKGAQACFSSVRGEASRPGWRAGEGGRGVRGSGQLKKPRAQQTGCGWCVASPHLRTVGLALRLISFAPPSTLSKRAGVMMRTMPAPQVAPRHWAMV